MYQIFFEIICFVESLGYLGILIMTFIESTFIPIPAELTLIPAGYLVSKKEMHGLLVLITSSIGTLGGSLANYYIAYFFGRKLFSNKSKYFFINESKLEQIESFFANYGKISVFTGRFIPGIKHFISFPAGLAQMDIKTFCLYTLFGGAIWCTVLILLGYVIGENEYLIKRYLKELNVIFLILVGVLFALYYLYKKKIPNQ